MTLSVEVPVLCIQCREFSDDRARFCPNCGASLLPATCPSCGQALPPRARFCPDCGEAATYGETAAVAPGTAVPAAAETAAEALLAPRVAEDAAAEMADDEDVADEDEDRATPEERELVRRVRRDRERAGIRKRTIGMVVAAFAILVVALAAAYREPRPSMIAADVPPSDVTAPAPVARGPADEREPPAPVPPRPADEREPPAAVPRHAAEEGAPSAPRETGGASAEPPAGSGTTVELPSRAARVERRPPEIARLAPPAIKTPQRPWMAPAALPSAVARRPAMDLRADVEQVANPFVAGAVDYKVRLSQASGEPVIDADVRLRGLLADGALVEARLDRTETPGAYHALLAFSARGPRQLTLRISRFDSIVEMPVADGPRPALPSGR